MNVEGAGDLADSLSKLDGLLSGLLGAHADVSTSIGDDGFSVDIGLNTDTAADADTGRHASEVSANITADGSVDMSGDMIDTTVDTNADANADAQLGSVETTADISTAATADITGGANLDGSVIDNGSSIDAGVNTSGDVSADAASGDVDVGADNSVSSNTDIGDTNTDVGANVAADSNIDNGNASFNVAADATGDDVASVDDASVATDGVADIGGTTTVDTTDVSDGVVNFDPTNAIPGNLTTGLSGFDSLPAGIGSGDPGRSALDAVNNADFSRLGITDPTLLNGGLSDVNFGDTLTGTRDTIEPLDSSAVDDIFTDFGLTGTQPMTPMLL
jgi:hypothetical protein